MSAKEKDTLSQILYKLENIRNINKFRPINLNVNDGTEKFQKKKKLTKMDTWRNRVSYILRNSNLCLRIFLQRIILDQVFL